MRQRPDGRGVVVIEPDSLRRPATRRYSIPVRQRGEAVRTATLSAETLKFAAHAMGLGTAPMIGFDAQAVARDFGLAENEVLVILIRVGHALPENWPQKPRRRASDIPEHR